MEFFVSILNYLKKQIGVRSDSASSTGSLHAKMADVKDAVAAISPIASIQRGVTLLEGNVDVSKNVTISSVTTSKTVVSFLGFYTPYDSNSIYYDRLFPFIKLTNSTTLTVQRGADGGGYDDIYVSWEVIEYN